ncbi:predicted protein [Naegleria gruberi]|uniref:Predicted protein n=1 Tax=Naegleria gruberi TaxID=5762 RepID=D2V5L6_NAEGR|nr:uncharacterized protein NAEGRDRAFT_64124 [Naegleria gruberi]EFC47668.1 predicted protein [Naegleria gruberi]|eukprot:XP_002680412.1 predicted protein [Naegleria gruberi strain NEG-M]
MIVSNCSFLGEQQDFTTSIYEYTENDFFNLDNFEFPSFAAVSNNANSNLSNKSTQEELDPQELFNDDIWNEEALQYETQFIMQPFFPLKYENYYGYNICINNAEELDLINSQRFFPNFRINCSSNISDKTRRKLIKKTDRMRDELRRNKVISLKDIESQIVNIKYGASSKKEETSKSNKRGRPGKSNK